MRILAISGSLRRESSNRALVDAATRLAPSGVAVAIGDGLDALPLFNPDLDTDPAPPPVQAFRLALRDCDAVLISSPEYAHGVPGALKNALDWVVSSGEFIDKPVALVNASSRASHAWSSLAETLTVMSARLVREASVTIPLDGLQADAARIVATPSLSEPLRSALQRLVRQIGLVPAYELSKARIQDVEAIPAIELAAARLLSGHAPDSVLNETTSVARLEQARQEGHLWVVLANDVAVGYAHVEPVDPVTVHLEEIDVLPEHGRRGLGTRLVEAICRWAGGAGYERVTLTTFRDVDWNAPFYARVGFEIVPAEELTPHLAQVMDEEASRGLDRSRRVAMQRRCATTITVGDSAPPADLQRLEDALNEYNFAATDIHDARLLVGFVRDAGGQVCAGLSGHTWGQVAEVRILWVAERVRGLGLGTRLLDEAEREALARGCSKMVLSTHSFQAPEFYRRRGFVVAGRFDDYPRGHQSLFLEKRLLRPVPVAAAAAPVLR